MANRVRKIPAAPATRAVGKHVPGLRRRGKVRGQTLAIVAIMMLGLLAMVGLAVDGGSMYGQRRQAQNAADGASIAGTRLMLDLYIEMARHNAYDVDGSPGEERAILSAIENYASKHGVSTAPGSGDLEAYFVDDAKQIVTVGSGQGGCGGVDPCKVGENNRVPWTLGAKGIVVRARSHTPAFFMAIFGTTEVSAVASATAFMGVATSAMLDVAVMPIGFFTDTRTITDNLLVPGEEYTLIQGSSTRGAGNWGYVDWNGNGDPSGMVNTWLMCGFNPGVSTAQQWAEWCPPYPRDTDGMGPTMYWQGQRDSLSGPLYRPELQWPSNPDDWWWIAGSTGTTNSTCQFFRDIAPIMVNREYLIPMFDPNVVGSGQNTKFHLMALGWFRITRADIVCHRNDPIPTPTPGGPTPTPGPAPQPLESTWSIMGEFLRHYSATSSGGHGDIRHTSNPTVFLSP